MVTRSAPGKLEFVRAFVNTRDVEEGADAIAEPQGLAGWLTSHGLMEDGAGVAPGDVRRAAFVREALRALLLANAGRELDPGAGAVLDAAALRARLRLRFLPDGSARERPDAVGVDGALGRLLEIVGAAMADGTWARLKVCRNDECLWAFYDRARNRSRVWCSMAVCGNRMKVRAYRRRAGETAAARFAR